MAVRGGTAVCVQGARGRELVSTSHMLVRASRWTSQAGQGHLAYGRTSQPARTSRDNGDGVDWLRTPGGMHMNKVNCFENGTAIATVRNRACT